MPTNLAGQCVSCFATIGAAPPRQPLFSMNLGDLGSKLPYVIGFVFIAGGVGLYKLAAQPADAGAAEHTVGFLFGVGAAMIGVVIVVGKFLATS